VRERARERLIMVRVQEKKRERWGMDGAVEGGHDEERWHKRTWLL
jgi:hypothetical protein